ncbi:MAG TPA: sigma 54-interacting transcriptional regulator [Kofleriaceae bacterium]|jgi:DNA-binding NtrC family response regulator
MADSDPNATEPIGPASDTFTFQRFRVVVVVGPDTGKECVAAGPELSIGTGPASDLVLGDPTVSRHHCAIEAAPRGYHLRDLGSTNGTRIGHHFVDSIYLAGEAVISLGTTAVKFEILDETVRERLVSGDSFAGLLGRSAPMRRIFTLVPRLAASDATILIDGETGTGKTLLADAIHRSSPRAAGPFVAVDCAAIPPNLIESELFGHEQGAFTGAIATRIGAFETAGGGTLFLDEIGELPLDMQPKLLRVLESRQIKRVGGSQPMTLDVRVIAATNRDLREAVNAGTFRSDLFYRLNVVRLHVPPLRERREDIAPLVEHFFRQFSGQPDAAAPPALVMALERQAWPGNVREVRAAIERAVLLGDPSESGPTASSGLPELPLDLDVPYRIAKQQIVDHWERSYLVELLRQSRGSITRAARRARTDRNYLRERLVRLKIPTRLGADE